MTKNVNTSESLKKPAKKTNAQLNAEANILKEAFKNGKQVEVAIPKAFVPVLTDQLFVAVNGVHLYVPVDGNKHPVPEAHALVIEEMIRNLK